jgi:phospho-N-acetylmuramoyl-pentapeptide-transferase
MLVYLLDCFSDYYIGEVARNLFSYVTFRAAMAFFCALIIMIIWGQKFLYFLFIKGIRDTSGDFISLNAFSKKGTPTAGGISIVIVTTVVVLLFCRFSYASIVWTLIGFLYFGLVGFIDDIGKVRSKTSLGGLSQKTKTILLLIFTVIFSFWFVSSSNSVFDDIYRTAFSLPFYKNLTGSVHPFIYFIFLIFFIFSVSNAINITDGQDGLLSGLSLITLGVYALFAFIIGNAVLSMHYLYPFIEGGGELVVFAAALMGSIVGFLWYNTFPAEVFMGDTGSLAIGGAISMIAIFIKQEVLFLIVGGVFVFEIFSSLIQEKVGDRIGRRIFFRAPFHHQLTHMGVGEPKATMRLIIIGLLLGAFAIITIKIR